MCFVKEELGGEEVKTDEMVQAEDREDEPLNINEELSKNMLTGSARKVDGQSLEEITATFKDTRSPFGESNSRVGPFHLHKQTSSSLQYSASNTNEASRK